MKFEDIGERDGRIAYFNSFGGAAFIMLYVLRKDGKAIDFLVPSEAYTEEQTDSCLQGFLADFERLSDDPERYFMYRYFKLVLRWRADNKQSREQISNQEK